MPKTKDKTEQVVNVQIKRPNIQTVKLVVRGTAPYMQQRFPEKAIRQIKEKHEAGSQAKKGTKREARDFDAEYLAAMHKAPAGWHGIPAPAFRNAMISACRLCGFKMTIGKLSVFIEADGFDEVDWTPLVKISGDPERDIRPARNKSGVCDLRARPLWKEWSALVRIRFDADMLSVDDVGNLLMRAGMQVGIGEGRPDSRDGNGIGFGLFDVEGQA
jgi:hypothetical protein